LEIDEDENYGIRMAKDYRNIGIVLDNMNKYDEALEFHEKALKIDEKEHDKIGLATDYYNKCIVLEKRYPINKRKILTFTLKAKGHIRRI